MFKLKDKAQGALEYLLLIGGAVLIAVIVIALLVGMGGQSRDTAQNQATQAQQSLEQPQPASIVSIKGLWADDQNEQEASGLDDSITIQDCNGQGSNAWFRIDWQELGPGGVHTLKLYNNQNTEVSADHITVYNVRSGNDFNATTPQLTDSPAIVHVEQLGAGCYDTHWAEILTEKNGQIVKSTRRKFYWPAE
jgi:hypothetical protein